MSPLTASVYKVVTEEGGLPIVNQHPSPEALRTPNNRLVVLLWQPLPLGQWRRTAEHPRSRCAEELRTMISELQQGPVPSTASFLLEGLVATFTSIFPPEDRFRDAECHAMVTQLVRSRILTKLSPIFSRNPSTLIHETCSYPLRNSQVIHIFIIQSPSL